MADETGSRINFAVNLVLAQIIATMRKVPFRGVGKFTARLNFFLVGMAISTEGFLMAGSTGEFRVGINFMLEHEIRSLVIESTPGVGMALCTVG